MFLHEAKHICDIPWELPSPSQPLKVLQEGWLGLLSLFFVTYLTFGCAGSSLLSVAFSAAASQVMATFLIPVASLVAEQTRVLRLQQLQHMGSEVVHEFSCSVFLWNLPEPGIKPISPALAGRFLSTGPWGKSRHLLFAFPQCLEWEPGPWAPCQSSGWTDCLSEGWTLLEFIWKGFQTPLLQVKLPLTWAQKMNFKKRKLNFQAHQIPGLFIRPTGPAGELLGRFSSLQFLTHVRLFATPWIAARQASLSITNSQSLPKLMSIVLVMPSNRLILCHPLLLLPSIFPSIRVFSNESALCIRWPKYWSFSFSISPSTEHPGPISFGVDWLDLLAV